MAEEHVTKPDVARRQLSVAIHLFFEEQDVIAIHTLASASHQILVDLGKNLGIGSAVKNTSGMKPREVQAFLRRINYPYNFLKHADRDPGGAMNIAPLNRLTQRFIMDAVWMLQVETEDIPFELKVFWAWYVSRYPEEFDDLPSDGAIAQIQKLQVSKMAFRDISLYLKLNDALPEELLETLGGDSRPPPRKGAEPLRPIP